jgi:hypothetical protein
MAQETASSRPAGNDVRHSAVSPAIKNDRSWKARIDALLAELKPTPREQERIRIEAGRISRNLRRVLRSPEQKQ